MVIFGAGRMGSALLRGWLSQTPDMRIGVVDPAPSEEVRAWAEAGKVALSPPTGPAEILVTAVKPQMFTDVAPEMRPYVGRETLVLSIMAGTRLKQLSEALGSGRVIRAMPNTPGAIGKGVSVICAPKETALADIDTAKDLLGPLGLVEGPIDENLFSTVSALSGSGPAYLFLLAEVMAESAEAEGVPRDLAKTLAVQTVIGSAALLEATGDAPSDLRKAVTSPGGITQAALDILMDDGGMPALMRRALRAAALRDQELSREDS